MNSKLFITCTIFLHAVFLFPIHFASQGIGNTSVLDYESQNDIDAQYHPNAISISKKGIIKGKAAIKSLLLEIYQNQGSLIDTKTHYKIPVNNNSNLKYEIGSFQTENGDRYANLIIWEKANDLEQKIVEVSYKISTSAEVPKEITEARKNWMKLCNKNNSKNLVEELYTADAIYYNRGRILKGHTQLIQEYSYMNNPSYSLQLTPKYVEMVTNDIAFEIGMCSGSYPLPYMLVWKKQLDGNWRIYFDSNY